METITVTAIVAVQIETVWNCWTAPEHITQWNAANTDWHTPAATNDLQVGGRFNYRMAAKDGSVGFDFSGVYTAVEPYRLIAYTLGDGRKVRVEFTVVETGVHIVEIFEPESINSISLQEAGWQAILNSFKNYVEA